MTGKQSVNGGTAKDKGTEEFFRLVVEAMPNAIVMDGNSHRDRPKPPPDPGGTLYAGLYH